jgi:hypothetical protein
MVRLRRAEAQQQLQVLGRLARVPQKIPEIKLLLPGRHRPEQIKWVFLQIESEREQTLVF